MDLVQLTQPSTAPWFTERMAYGLSKIDRAIDNTALSAFMACPREYFYSMMLHRRPAEKSSALSYGTLWHTLLEWHYKSNGSEPIVRHVWEQVTYEDQPGDHRTKERAWVDYLGYRKRWGQTPEEEHGKTVGFPDAPLVEISVNAQGTGLIHPYAGKIDRVIEDSRLYYNEDHKTTSRLDRHYFRQYENSNQMKGYTYLANLLLPEVKVIGVRINLLHILKGGSNYERQVVTYSPDILREWEANTNLWLGRLADCVGLYYQLIEAGVEDNAAVSMAFPMHFGDNGCSRKFGLCQYHSVCSASPRIRQRILEREFAVVEWNPLAVEDTDNE